MAASRESFRLAVARMARDKLVNEGWVWIDIRDLERLAQTEGLPERMAGLVIDDLEARGYIYRDGRAYKGGLRLVLEYEQQHDRAAFYESNVARRELLAAAADAFDRDERLSYRRDDPNNYTTSSWETAHGAAVLLEGAGFGDLQDFLGGNFRFEVTATGYDVARDEAQLRHELPVSAEEDASPAQPSPAAPSANANAADGSRQPGVFVSYSHTDHEFVHALVAQLQTLGVGVWIDTVELAIGDSLIKRVSEAIHAEDFVVAVVSENSVQSGWCQKELSMALTRGINNNQVTVLPVRLGNVDMPEALRDVLWADDEKDDPAAVASALARSIEKHLQG